MMQCYENKDFYFFWKPHNIPSTFGKQKSFLEYMEDFSNNIENEENSSIFKKIPVFIEKHINWLTKVADINKAIKNQLEHFTKEQEYWLINRLDNETAGLLYFAKTLSTSDDYRQQQVQLNVKKHYIAQISGKFNNNTPLKLWNGGIIDFPIMHRSSKRMIAIKTSKDIKKWSWKQHQVQTLIEFLEYDPKYNISTLLVTIHKGIRHQIRVHLASIASPIIWDSIYNTDSSHWALNLWSVWCEIKE